MKKLQKILAIILALALLFALTACGNSNKDDQSESNSDSVESNSGDTGDTYVVGICQLVTHDALDAATQGFKDSLTEEFGDAVKFVEENAAGDVPTCATIANSFVSQNVDLILGNGTAALAAAATATTSIPVLGTSITEYGVALEIKDFSGTVGGNVSGTSDLAPLEDQAKMLAEWFPVDTHPNVGLLYCSAEANSQYQVDNVKKYLEDMGYTCTLYPFSDSNDAAAVTQSAADASDVIYVPTDNTAASNASLIDGICQPAGVPIIAGEEGICKGCGVATLSISYYDLGVTTGKMAAKILKGEADISEMPIEYAENFTPKYNPTICEALNLTPPEGYEAIG